MEKSVTDRTKRKWHQKLEGGRSNNLAKRQ